MKLLSVIIPKSDESLQDLCKSELKGLDYEIISTVSREDGLKHATGEFVCFVEAEATLSEGYFWENLRIFTSQPSFRKLAIVSSRLSGEWDPSGTSSIYGYILANDGSKPKILPSHVPSSSQPYAVQIAYIPGSIIRRSILNSDTFTKDVLGDSVRLSLRLWQEGSRVYLNPRSTYYDASTRKVQYPFEYKMPLPPEVIQLTSMFRREMIA